MSTPVYVISAQTKPRHKLYYSRSITCKHSIHLIGTHKTHSSRLHEFGFGYQQTLQNKTDVAKIKKKTYYKEGGSLLKSKYMKLFFLNSVNYYNFGHRHRWKY